jgi:hypothetical protein
VTRSDDGGAADVKGCDGTRITIEVLPPSILITPSLLACAEADRFASTNIPKQLSIADSFLLLIISPVSIQRSQRLHSVGILPAKSLFRAKSQD